MLVALTCKRVDSMLGSIYTSGTFPFPVSGTLEVKDGAPLSEKPTLWLHLNKRIGLGAS